MGFESSYVHVFLLGYEIPLGNQRGSESNKKFITHKAPFLPDLGNYYINKTKSGIIHRLVFFDFFDFTG